MRFIVLGAGAVGGVVGGRLFEHGHDVVLVARGEHGKVLAEDGLTLASATGVLTLPVPATDRLDSIRWQRRRSRPDGGQEPGHRGSTTPTGCRRAAICHALSVFRTVWPTSQRHCDGSRTFTASASCAPLPISNRASSWLSPRPSRRCSISGATRAEWTQRLKR